jgi:hypothetical protein
LLQHAADRSCDTDRQMFAVVTTLESNAIAKRDINFERA